MVWEFKRKFNTQVSLSRSKMFIRIWLNILNESKNKYHFWLRSVILFRIYKYTVDWDVGINTWWRCGGCSACCSVVVAGLYFSTQLSRWVTWPDARGCGADEAFAKLQRIALMLRCFKDFRRHAIDFQIPIMEIASQFLLYETTNKYFHRAHLR